MKKTRTLPCCKRAIILTILLSCVYYLEGKTNQTTSLDSIPILTTIPSLEGFVYDRAGKGIKNVEIAVFDTAIVKYEFFNTQMYSTYSVRTDTSGFYKVQNLPRGTYIILARADSSNLVAQFYANTDSLKNAKKITVDSLPIKNINFTLRTGARVNGKVIDNSFRPIENVDIQLHPVGGGQFLQSKTNPLGEYNFQGLQSGEWTITLWHYNYSIDTFIKVKTTEGQDLSLPPIVMRTSGFLKGTYTLPITDSMQLYSLEWIELFNDSASMDSTLWYKRRLDISKTPDSGSFNQGRFYVNQCPPGIYKGIFTPGPQNMLYTQMTDTLNFQSTFKKGLGYTIIGGSNLLANGRIISVNSGDTSDIGLISPRQGYSVSGKVTVKDTLGNSLPLSNYKLSVEVQNGRFYIPIVESWINYNGRFEIPGLIDTEKYFIRLQNMSGEWLYWSPKGISQNRNTPYVFSTSSFTPVVIDVNSKDFKRTQPANGPVNSNLYIHMRIDTIPNVITCNYPINKGIDSLFLFSTSQDTKSSLLQALLVNPSTPGQVNFIDSRTLSTQTYYAVIAKGDSVRFRSNITVYDPKMKNVLTPTNLWFNVSSSRWGPEIEWAGMQNFQYSDKDSVAIYKKNSQNTWIQLKKVPYFYQNTHDYNWTKSDSFKTLEYRIEFYQNGVKVFTSQSKYFTLDQNFFSQLSRRFYVGSFEKFTTIQSAIDAASNYDQISILPGVYKENLNLRGKILEIHGQWRNDKPPVLDGSGDVAVTIPFSSDMIDRNSTSISALKITNSTIGIKSFSSVHVSNCLFVNTAKAISLDIDSLRLSTALQSDPFIPIITNGDIKNCTFIAKKPGDFVAHLTEKNSAAVNLDSTENFNWNAFQIYPIPLLTSRIFITNSIFAYYSSVALQAGLPISMSGKGTRINANYCDFWNTSVLSQNPRFIIQNKYVLDPMFVDTSDYFTSTNSPLVNITANDEMIGYNNPKQTGSNSGNQLPPVTNLQTRVINFNKILVTWTPPAQTLGISYYKIYRIYGDSTYFYVNENSQWDLRISEDLMMTIMDTFTVVKNYFLDTTVTPGKPYIYAVVAIDSSDQEGKVDFPASRPLSHYMVNTYMFNKKITANTWYMIGPWGAPNYISQPTSSTIFHWDESSPYSKLLSYYTMSTQIKPTWGYWYQSSKDTVLAIDSLSLKELLRNKDSLKISIYKGQTGWNQISSPLPFTAKPSWLANYKIWEWNPDSAGYRLATSLAPWKAYWLRTSKDTILPLNATTLNYDTTNFVLAKSALANAISWEMQVKLSSNNVSDPDNYLGIINKNMFTSGQFDNPEPPPAFYTPSISFYQDSLNERFASLYKTVNNNNISDLQWHVVITSRPSKVSLEFNQFGSLPKDYNVYWIDKNGILNLNKLNKVQISSSQESHHGYILVSNNPKTVMLFSGKIGVGAIYPNPFKSRLTLEIIAPYEWDKNGAITNTSGNNLSIKLFDLQGRSSNILYNKKTIPGIYKLNFNTSTIYNLHSGLHLVKVSYGKHFMVKPVFKLQ